MGGSETTNPAEPSSADLARSPRERAWREHNDGHRTSSNVSRRSSETHLSGLGESHSQPASSSANGHHKAEENKLVGAERTKVFSAQSYLRYQGDKVSCNKHSGIEVLAAYSTFQFTGRYDANCYIHITRKLDTHDLSIPSNYPIADSISSSLPPPDLAADDEALASRLIHALSLLPQALVIGIESDGLFTTTEQKEIAAHIPDAELVLIPSPDGHDGFLLEFEAINGWIDGWLRRKMPEFFTEEARLISPEEHARSQREAQEGFDVKKESVFGEAEADVTAW